MHRMVWRSRECGERSHPVAAARLVAAFQGVRQKNFNKIKKQIEQNLFLAKPTFASHLKEICE